MPQNADPGTALLSLVQWLSPAFPTGAYAYTHGLESEMAGGGVTSAADLMDWLMQLMTYGAGLQDAIL